MRVRVIIGSRFLHKILLTLEVNSINWYFEITDITSMKNSYGKDIHILTDKSILPKIKV